MTGLVRLTLTLCLLSSEVAWSQAWVQTGRYSAVAAVPTPAQEAPLNAIISVQFPDGVTTVGQAIQRVVAGTGYSLSDILHWDIEVLELFERSLPSVHRNLGPLSVSRALKTLVGPAFHVVIDPVHRLVGFELNPAFEPLGFGRGDQSQEADQWKPSF